VIQLSAPLSRAKLYNNLVWDGGTPPRAQVLVAGHTEGGAVAGACNWVAAGFGRTDFASLDLKETVVAGQGTVVPWLDSARGDYRLRERVAQIADTGCPLPADARALLGGPLREYQNGAGWRRRPDDGKPDLGAHEWVRGEKGQAAKGSYSAWAR